MCTTGLNVMEFLSNKRDYTLHSCPPPQWPSDDVNSGAKVSNWPTLCIYMFMFMFIYLFSIIMS